MSTRRTGLSDTNVFLINKRIISHTNIFHTSKLLSGAFGGGGGEEGAGLIDPQGFL